MVDAERLWNDPLEEIGQGIVYRKFEGYVRHVAKDVETRLLGLWKWHQQRLRRHLSEGVLLLNCHSSPRTCDVDICIGYNEDWSKPCKATIEYAVNLFEDNGYSVGINYLYSNSKTPECPFRYQSMMLEVNKRTYLESGNIKIRNSYSGKWPVNEVIAQFIGGI